MKNEGERSKEGEGRVKGAKEVKTRTLQNTEIVNYLASFLHLLPKPSLDTKTTFCILARFLSHNLCSRG